MPRKGIIKTSALPDSVNRVQPVEEDAVELKHVSAIDIT